MQKLTTIKCCTLSSNHPYIIKLFADPNKKFFFTHTQKVLNTQIVSKRILKEVPDNESIYRSYDKMRKFVPRKRRASQAFAQLLTAKGSKAKAAT